jgi:hypothetical protein
LDAFDAAVPPCSAVVRFSFAAASAASALTSAVSAAVGSIFAMTCPALSCSPTETSTAVSVPLVGKLADAVLAEPMLPVDVSVAWTVPLVTVAVRVAPVAAEAVWKIDASPNPATASTARTRIA